MLKEGSSAIDAGEDLGDLVTEDFFGNKRTGKPDSAQSSSAPGQSRRRPSAAGAARTASSPAFHAAPCCTSDLLSPAAGRNEVQPKAEKKLGNL